MEALEWEESLKYINLVYQFPKIYLFQLKVSSIQTSELANHLDYICLHTHYATSLTFDYFYQI
jgi:hypothetical protein